MKQASTTATRLATFSLTLITTVALLIAVGLASIPLYGQASQDFQTLVEEATAARQSNDLPRAIQLYSRAIAVNPQWPNGWLDLGLLHYQTGSYAAARDALTRFIALTSEPGPALGLRGLCEFETGEYARSLRDIRKGLSSGIAEQPRQEELLRYHEAMLLTKLGKFEDALRTYAAFAHRNISTPEIFVGIGLAGLRMPLFPKEATKNKDLLELAGSAAFQLMVGNEQRGGQEFNQLLQRFPDLVNAHYFYGFMLFTSDPDAAFTEFQREVALHPSNSQGQIMEAWSLLLRRDPEAALPHALKAAVAKPVLPAAQLVLGRSLVETGEVKNGIEHLRQALQLEPKNLEIHIALAEAYSKAGNRAEAQRERMLCLQMTQDGVNRVALP